MMRATGDLAAIADDFEFCCVGELKEDDCAVIDVLLSVGHIPAIYIIALQSLLLPSIISLSISVIRSICQL